MTKFNSNVKIVDMIMGSGKTSAAINYINGTDDSTRFLFITPYLDEVQRIKELCSQKNFKEPEQIGTKLRGIKHLFSNGENIVSTHALFQSFDEELIALCKKQNYTLILDESISVAEKYELSKEDFEILTEKLVDIDESTGLVTWRDTGSEYTGKFQKEKNLCELQSLAYYGGSTMMWLFPIEVFNSFSNIYVLTYMFKSQILRYYYDYYKIPYKYIYVAGDSVDNYHFTELKANKQNISYDFKKLIHILEDGKLNSIGSGIYDLSKSWYIKNQNEPAMKQLKNNVSNFFWNKRNTKSGENLWTTFKDFRKYLTGKGYSKAFASLNIKSTNQFKDRISVAYLVNKYIDTGIKNFFEKYNVKVNDDDFAVSEMLQFIWRSAIRNGEEIWLYIPSARMRNLLKKWIAKNSKK